MEETVTLKPSQSQAIGLTVFYVCLAGITVLMVTQMLPMILIIGVVIVFAVEDLRKLRQGHYHLRVKNDGSINLWQLNTETCYPECRMYYNRWCMVIKLKNHSDNRSILLTPDRFDDEASYVRLRYFLLQLQERCSAT